MVNIGAAALPCCLTYHLLEVNFCDRVDFNADTNIDRTPICEGKNETRERKLVEIYEFKEGKLRE